jgi:DDE superfamily endonuclease
MDNLNIHRRKSLRDLLGEEFGGEVWDRFTVHYMPTHGSWLNQAEIEIGILSRQCLGIRRIPDILTLSREGAGLESQNRRSDSCYAERPASADLPFQNRHSWRSYIDVISDSTCKCIQEGFRQ